MKCLLILIISCICISCYNTSDIVFIEKQLDKEIQLIKNQIVTETNAIQIAYANGVGKNTQDVCEELFLSSEKINSLYLAIVDSSIDLYNKKEGQKEILLDADNIVFETETVEIVEVKDVGKEYRRYDINVQLN